MRCRLRVRLKSLGLVLGFASLFYLLFTLDDGIRFRKKQGQKSIRNGRRVASISGEDLDITYASNRGIANSTNLSRNHTSSHPPQSVSDKTATTITSNIIPETTPKKDSPISVCYEGKPCKTVLTNLTSQNKLELKRPEANGNDLSLEISNRIDAGGLSLELQPPRTDVDIEEFLDKVYSLTNGQSLPLNDALHQDLLRRNDNIDDIEEVLRIRGFQNANRLKYRRRQNIYGKGYQGRVTIVNTTLPSTWSLTTDLSSKLKERKEHVKKVCHDRQLDIRNGKYQPNAWEFVVSDKHHLAWCNIFKAASSTWFYNFNILAGYSENSLLKAKDTPITMARKKYPRIDVRRLDEISNNGTYLKFMIARHPFDRLVSAFRDKLENANRFYRDTAKKIILKYSKLPGPKKPVEITVSNDTSKLKTRKTKASALRYVSPSFTQFVQYLLDSNLQGDVLNEHWIPMSSFCTPCLVDFDVYAKVETLNEDGNYIIFTSGIEKVIKPKLINRSKNGPTESVTSKYLCSLSDEQKVGLVKLYQLDFDLFQYDYKKYFDCDTISK